MSDELTRKKCVPCEGGVPALSEAEEDGLLEQLSSGWEVDREEVHKLQREFVFESYSEAMGFLNQVAEIAESEGHHPDFHNYFKKVVLEFHTHAIGGLSENDFICAAKVDQLRH